MIVSGRSFHPKKRERDFSKPMISLTEYCVRTVNYIKRLMAVSTISRPAACRYGSVFSKFHVFKFKYGDSSQGWWHICRNLYISICCIVNIKSSKRNTQYYITLKLVIAPYSYDTFTGEFTWSSYIFLWNSRYFFYSICRMALAQYTTQ